MSSLQNTREGLINAFRLLQEIEVKTTESNMQNLYSAMVLIKKSILQIEEEFQETIKEETPIKDI